MTDEYDEGESWASIDDLVAELDLDPGDPFGRTGSDAAAGSRPVRWRDLPPEQAQTEWVVLRSWVEWVTTRFDVAVSVIPNCWWKHPALVEELSALHTAWRTAYDPHDTGHGPLTWLERWANAKPRLINAHGGCSSSHHEVKRRTWHGITDQDEWDAWITGPHGT